ncbi:MAG: hypothetical protein MZW92_19540 [Comamonadaceae bacterium]|nr:hypothetical protein [Comamonadaceae bacterium]
MAEGSLTRAAQTLVADAAGGEPCAQAAARRRRRAAVRAQAARHAARRARRRRCGRRCAAALAELQHALAPEDFDPQQRARGLPHRDGRRHRGDCWRRRWSRRSRPSARRSTCARCR